MGFFRRLFRRFVSFKVQPSDLQMLRASRNSGIGPGCDCLAAQYGTGKFGELALHAEIQNTESDAWKMLLDLVERAASKRSKEFAPGLEMPPELWSQIVTLPVSISKLTSVRKLYLYGSHLVRLPSEVGELVKLEELDLYTSYRLHWVPFEVTRCSSLRRSRVSTRALYGNYKYRAPFPRVGVPESKLNLPTTCGVCRGTLRPGEVHQAWISLLVATDVLPLLVNACSEECIKRLPPPAYGYVDHPHTGGLELPQPSKAFGPPNPGRKWMRD
jgi:hypothetical protein